MPCNEGHTVRSCILLWTASGKDGKKQQQKKQQGYNDSGSYVFSECSFQLSSSYLNNHKAWGNLHNDHCRHFGLLSGNLQDSLACGGQKTTIKTSDKLIIHIIYKLGYAWRILGHV